MLAGRREAVRAPPHDLELSRTDGRAGARMKSQVFLRVVHRLAAHPCSDSAIRAVLGLRAPARVSTLAASVQQFLDGVFQSFDTFRQSTDVFH